MAKLSSGTAAVAALGLCVLLALLAGQGQLAAAGYGYTTDRGGDDVQVQGTVRGMVQQAIRDKPSVGPALVRLLFHDCWVYVSDLFFSFENCICK